MLGQGRRARAITRALHERGVRATHVEHPAEADGAVDEHTRALVVVPPMEKLSVEDLAWKTRDSHPQLPIFVALGGPASRRQTRAMYDAGVHAVFVWPAERAPLLRTVARLTGVLLGEARPANLARDVALEEIINDRLRTASTRFGGSLAARVQHRIAILEGQVDALWKVAVAEGIAAEVPGVEEAVSVTVRVTGPSETDRAIARAVRQLLANATALDAGNVVVKVKGGRVSLRGAAPDRVELARALRLVEHIRGVRAIESYVTTDAGVKTRDDRVAKRVARAIEAHAPKSKLDVAVFAGVVELTGKVESAAARRALVELADAQDGVRHVVDKLRVR